MSPDPHEDRAAREAAWNEYRDRLTAAQSGQGAAFHAAWQARGAYDRERQRATLERLRTLIHESNSHDYDGEDGCFEDCFVCEADLILGPALASAPIATGESAGPVLRAADPDEGGE